MLLEPVKDAADIGIYAKDIQKSLDFYQGILGLKKTQELKGLTGTIHRLEYGKTDIKLIDPTEPPPIGPIGINKQLGFRYITFVIKNIKKLCETLEEKGIEFERPLTETRPGITIAMVRDPDGNVIEFVERS
ncbi:VOC family protein [Thermodesulfobacteriota bacterium]